MKAIFIVLDTVRKDYLQAYGNDWVKTPNLSRLAKDGVVFDNHWVGSLPCMPARREFMTGRHNFLYRGWGPIEPYDDILPVELKKKGIFSHFLTDHYHYFELGGENYHTGFTTWEFFRGQEGDQWVSIIDSVALPEGYPGLPNNRMRKQNVLNRLKQQKEEEFSGPRTAQSAINWLDTNGKSDSWFLQVEIFDPHEPFYCTEKYRKMYGDKWDGPIYDWPPYEEVKDSPEAVEHIRKCYAGLLTMTDFWVGKIFDKLQDLKIWDDVLIIFTTDHGTLLAEHKYWMKSYMPLYNELVQIPLILKAPGNKNAGSRVKALTQTIDVMPTFLDFFGCPIPPHVQGVSLRKSMIEQVREDIILGYFGMAVNITDGKYIYFRNPVQDDGGPLHAYTAMPIKGLNSWYPREKFKEMEMGRYFGHTYNLPLYKIEEEGKLPRPLEGAPSYAGRHQLFDIIGDPKQNSPMQNPKLEQHFIERISAHLKQCEAPKEQFIRLGIDTPTV
jgi:arylsulfatase A-like enzyme